MAIAEIYGAVKSVPVVGSFVSRIFKKPQTTDGYAKFCYTFADPSSQWYQPPEKRHPLVTKFILGQAMTGSEKRTCTRIVLSWTQNWTKAQKKSLQDALAGIRVTTEPTPKPVETHTVSASYSTQAQTKVVEKSRDVQEVVQAGISKIPIWVFVGIGALFIIPQLLRMRGGKE